MIAFFLGNATKRWTGSCEAISEALDFGLGCMMPFAANLGLKFEKIKNDPSYHSRFDSIPDLSTAYGLSLGSGDSSGKQEFDQLVPSGAPGISKIAGSQDRRKWNGRLKEAMCGYAIEKLDDCLNDKSFLDFTGCSSLEISAQNILLQLNIKCGRYPEFDNSTYAGVECIRAILNTTAGDKCVVEHGQKGLEKEFVEGPKDGYPHLCGGLKSTFDCFEPLVKANCQQKDAQKLFNNAKDFYDSVFKFAFGTGCVLKGVGVY